MKHYLQTRNNNYDIFDAFDDFFKPMFYDESRDLRTDIKETDSSYELEMELPGYAKNEIKISLENGYLTVNASKQKKEENEKKYLRREISENTSRSYYVGTDVTREAIKAKFDNGMLTLTVPKSEPKQLKGNNFIEIE